MNLFFPLLSICIFGFCLSTEAQNTQKITTRQTKVVPLKSNHPKITSSVKAQPARSSGVRGNEVIGEGQYLNFNKKIMARSITGEIPKGFPKHKIGQSKKEYVHVMKEWGKNNPDLIKAIPGEGQYLNFNKKIMERSITGKIPEGFPKHKIGQSKKEYVHVMKEWEKNNPNKVKRENDSNVPK